jgi:predicted ATP-dependent protease
VRATLQRIEAAAKLGFTAAVVPKALEGSLVIDRAVTESIAVHYAANLAEALDLVLDAPAKTRTAIAARLGGLVSIRPAP